jgi:hypothetical protein
VKSRLGMGFANFFLQCIRNAIKETQNSVLLSTWKEGLSAELSVPVYLQGRSV